MNYLYHRVPKNMRGKKLYPLNTLKEKSTSAYEEHVQKYRGREYSLQLRIPTLGCLWNDVLHLTAVNPKEIKQALIEAGGADLKMEYYQIDSESLDPKDTTVFLYADIYDDNKMDERNFTVYNPTEIRKFSLMPEATKHYYKEMVESGKDPLLYHKIPHILYKGELDVTNVPTISV